MDHQTRLKNMLFQMSVFSEEELRQDSKFTAILAQELEYVKAQTYDVVYPAFKGRQLIPVSNDADPGAETIAYKQWDQVGIANILANYADDIELVEVLAEEFITRVHGIALGYSYSIQDLRRSAMSGARLEQRRAAATRRGIEQKIEDVSAIGDTSTAMTGIANNANVTLFSPTTGTWSTATGAEMVADCLNWEAAMITANKQTFMPTTLALDIASRNYLARTRISTTGDTNTTALTAFLESAQSVTEVVAWNKLATADAAGTGPRAIMYTKSPDVLTLEIPQEYEQFPPQQKNLSFFVPTHARVAGVIIYYPIAVGYMDGL